ncbi:MAG: hypothetical protein BAA03_00315 [Caldibacillus debilis]|jgi:hypothetical protein|nr:MAG: hypothetical protein BAA03_00315 [Caldibacillus debilis]
MPSKVFFGDRSRAFGLRFYRHPSEPHLPDADDTHARFSDSPAEKLFSGKRMFPIFFISRRPEGRLFFCWSQPCNYLPGFFPHESMDFTHSIGTRR